MPHPHPRRARSGAAERGAATSQESPPQEARIVSRGIKRSTSLVPQGLAPQLNMLRHQQRAQPEEWPDASRDRLLN